MPNSPIKEPGKTFAVSSGSTIFFKIVFPTVWFTFMGLFTVTLLYAEFIKKSASLGLASMVMPMVLLSGFVFFYFTIMSLKRVELNDTHIYVSNYFKTIRLPKIAIESYKETNLGVFFLASIKFVEPTRFGKRITMLGSKTKWDFFKEQMPRQETEELEVFNSED